MIARDAGGRVASLTDANGNATAYAYDGFDRPYRTTYPNGSYEQASYDAGSRVTALRLRDGQQMAYGWDALGRACEVSRPETALNESSRAFAYDDLGRMTAAYDSYGLQLLWSHDALGRVTAERGAGKTAGGAMSFGYDLAGTAQDVTRSFTRSAAGEILGATTSNDAYAYRDQVAVDRGYGRNSLNQCTSAGPQTFGYDARGNLTSEAGPNGNTNYAYTADGLLVSAGSASFAYDPLNRLC